MAKSAAPPEFQQQVLDFLPRMRAVAFSLTQNRAAADDLVQDTAMRVLLAHDSFVPGTNFNAWMRRIMTNQFISGIRRRCEITGFEDVPEGQVAASQQNSIDIREINAAIRELPKDQFDALHWIAIQERSYDEMAEETGIAVGTLKSRVHRASITLRAHMDGAQRAAA
jgi:RNA polymerase sigma-70 factor (ECF subfamily)